ncbi:MAG: MerR family transcriptional regulator [Pirellulaceae bacterium]|nr:MerR family transcriptional regulator [Pirellulaceae bacterium]
MDDQDNRVTDSPPTVPFHRPGDTPTFELQGRVVACVGFRDPELEALLLPAGATVCLPHEPNVDILVVDSVGTDADSLREQLPGPIIERLQTGAIQVVGKSQLEMFFDDHHEGVRSLYSRSMVADLLGVPVSTIRSWQRRGLIQPVNNVSKLPYFDFEEVLAAKQIATLVELGLDPKTIESNLRRLAAWLPELNRPLNQLSILVDGKDILLRQGGGLVEPGGQRRIDFEHRETNEDPANWENEGDILPFAASQPAELTMHSRIDEYIDLAEQLEGAGELSEAIEVYRSLQLAFGPEADICLRVGELLFRIGDCEAARERFYMAIELDETMVEARAALGCVLAEIGQYEHAISALQGALEYHTDYADVHFQLARLQQSASNYQQAIRHWERFVTLSPTGPWADEARSQLQFLKTMPESLDN